MDNPTAPAVDQDSGWIDVPPAAPTPDAATSSPATSPTSASPTAPDTGWIDVPTPEQKDAQSKQQQQEEQQPPPPPSLTDFLTRQAPHSIKSTAENLGNAIMHADDTADAVVNVLKGGFQTLYRKAGFDIEENEADRAARAAVDYYKNRYGGIANIKHAFYTDPVGSLLDASAVVTLGGDALGAASKIADVANATRAAEVTGTLGKVAGTVGEFSNPVTWAPKAVGWVANKLAPERAVAASALDPAAQAQALQDAIREKAFDIAGQRTGPGVMPSQEDWIRAETEIRSRPPATPSAATPSAAPAKNPIYGKIYNTLVNTGGLTGVALELVAHHVYGALGAGLGAGALHYLPVFLKTAQGQQMLSGLAQGANVADKAAQIVPALNAAYAQYQQQQPQQPIDLSASPFVKAKGGSMNPELARVQRERLPKVGILRMLGR